MVLFVFRISFERIILKNFWMEIQWIKQVNGSMILSGQTDHLGLYWYNPRRSIRRKKSRIISDKKILVYQIHLQDDLEGARIMRRAWKIWTHVALCSFCSSISSRNFSFCKNRMSVEADLFLSQKNVLQLRIDRDKVKLIRCKQGVRMLKNQYISVP